MSENLPITELNTEMPLTTNIFCTFLEAFCPDLDIKRDKLVVVHSLNDIVKELSEYTTNHPIQPVQDSPVVTLGVNIIQQIIEQACVNSVTNNN